MIKIKKFYKKLLSAKSILVFLAIFACFFFIIQTVSLQTSRENVTYSIKINTNSIFALDYKMQNYYGNTRLDIFANDKLISKFIELFSNGNKDYGIKAAPLRKNYQELTILTFQNKNFDKLSKSVMESKFNEIEGIVIAELNLKSKFMVVDRYSRLELSKVQQEQILSSVTRTEQMLGDEVTINKYNDKIKALNEVTINKNNAEIKALRDKLLDNEINEIKNIFSQMKINKIYNLEPISSSQFSLATNTVLLAFISLILSFIIHLFILFFPKLIKNL